MAKTNKPKDRIKPGTSTASAEQRKIIFADAYIANGENGTGAAVSAGYAPKGAHVTASRLLKDPKVQLILEEKRAALAQKFNLTTESVLQQLAHIVHVDPRKFFRADGSLKLITELDDACAAALASVDVLESVDGGSPVLTKKIKLWDKNAAIDKAMRHLGQFSKDNGQQPAAVVTNNTTVIMPPEEAYRKLVTGG